MKEKRNGQINMQQIPKESNESKGKNRKGKEEEKGASPT